MLHIIGQTRQVISITSGKTSKIFECVSLSMDGHIWQVRSVSNGTAKPLFNLSLDPVNGLSYAVVDQKTKISPSVLLARFADRSVYQIPGVYGAENDGSVLLAVCFEALKIQSVDDSGIHLNAPTDRLSLTADDWVKAYLRVEQQATLPDYLRAEFAEIMQINGVSITFPESVLISQPEKQSEHQAVSVSVGAA
jgi:hypothetical protein